MEGSHTPRGYGRGRGIFRQRVSSTSVGRGSAIHPVTSTPLFDRQAQPDAHLPCQFGPPHFSAFEPAQSTKEKGDISVDVLTNVVKQIGQSIGDNIASCLESRTMGNVVGPRSATHDYVNSTDLSGLKLVLQSDIKEPVYFRGDGSEKFTVHEWEDIMLTYMRKRGYSIESQAEEVLSKLMGRARDVVRIGLRSNSSINLSRGPDPIFDILKQHFSDTAYSSMPLADFYATLPLHGESPFDYWIRLNRAIDVAEECLKRQYKTLDKPSQEVTVMFIRHCPDPELSLIFKCKPLHQWTAGEVHERLDEYQRERRYSRHFVSSPAVTTLRQEVHRPLSNPVHQVPASPVSKPVVPSPHVEPSQSSSDSLDRVVSMLERLLEQGQQQHAGRGLSRPTLRWQQRDRAAPSLPCRVCEDNSHTTTFHCRADHLCFLCHAAGHTRAECPNATARSSGTAVPSGNATRPQVN